MSQFYSDPTRAGDKWAMPDAEVFTIAPGDRDYVDEDGEPFAPGAYFQFCFSGCLPDSEPFGPYPTEADAISACRAMGDY
jgi:hypothetical protein